MSKRKSALVWIVGLALGVSLFAVPSIGQADVIITDISVTNSNGANFTGGAAGNLWVFSPITLAPGQSLVLTQNPGGGSSSLPFGLPGFNFDTSEVGPNAATQYTVAVNGTSFVDNSVSSTAGILNAGGLDEPGSTLKNEAANWVKIGGVAGSYDLYVGYADTLHSNACLDSGNCLPSSDGPPTVPNTIWDGTGGSTRADFFLGNATNLPSYPASPHCNVGETTAASFNCYDAGAILIVSTVPEPSSVLLVGTVLMGLAAVGLRRIRKIS